MGRGGGLTNGLHEEDADEEEERSERRIRRVILDMDLVGLWVSLVGWQV